MGTIYIFRGKAAAGKSTLADKLAKELTVPVIRKDDVLDAVKNGLKPAPPGTYNPLCYDILKRIIQTNLDLGVDMILDIALGDRSQATCFFKQLAFGEHEIFSFFVECSDREEWKRRHLERLENPLPHQCFSSFQHVLAHYEKGDVNPFPEEHVIDSAQGDCFAAIVKIIQGEPNREAPGLKVCR